MGGIAPDEVGVVGPKKRAREAERRDFEKAARPRNPEESEVRDRSPPKSKRTHQQAVVVPTDQSRGRRDDGPSERRQLRGHQRECDRQRDRDIEGRAGPSHAVAKADSKAEILTPKRTDRWSAH